jgi:hypothetical protein
MMPMRAVRALLAALLLLPAAARGETVELIPEDRAGWGAANLFAPITGLFLGGPGYWYSQRKIEVETTPPGAMLDLFYVRASFQKRYEQAEAPVTILLPSRVEAGPRDSVTIRALLDGYRQQELHLKVRSRTKKVMIDLSPLPNALVALTHTYFAGRATLAFLTKEALNFRVQEGADGFSVVLTETGRAPDADSTIEGMGSPLISSVKAQQIGEDLVVRVALTESARDGQVETRSRKAYDAVRGLHNFALDLVPPDRGARGVNRALEALSRIQEHHVEGCATVYDEALRQQLDPAALARALAPKGAFTDPFLRAALKRLGEVSSDGVIMLNDGSGFRAAVPIELVAAASQAAQAKGYLALLRQFVAELEPPDYRRQTLRGLIAPEVGMSHFDTILDVAETRERRCLAEPG